MASKKKNISEGLGSLLGGSANSPKADGETKSRRGRPKTQTKIADKTSEEGTKAGETRATFIVKKDLLEKIKALSFYDREQIKETIDTALNNYISQAGDSKVKKALAEYDKKKKK